MAAQIVPLVERFQPWRDWSQREVAEFYRVESVLIQAGLRIDTDRGVSDEGEPWFVFCRADTGEVFIHFARINSQYVVAGSAFDGVVRGVDFPALVRELIARHPLVQTRPQNRSNVFLHPAALLIAVVGTAFFHTGEAKAAESSDVRHDRHKIWINASSAPSLLLPQETILLEANQAAIILAGAALGLGTDLSPAAGAARIGDLSTKTADLISARAFAADAATASLPLLMSAVAGPQTQYGAPSAAPQDFKTIAGLGDLFHELWSPPVVGLQAPGGGSAVGDISALIDPSSGRQLAATVTLNDGAHGLAAAGGAGLFVVALSTAAMPGVEAVQIVQLSGALASFDPTNVLSAPSLPAALAGLINNGDHFIGAPIASHDPSTATDPTTALAPVTKPVVPDGGTPSVTPDSGSPSVGPPTTDGGPSGGHLPSTSGEPTSSDGTVGLSVAEIDAAVASFVAHAGKVAEVATGANLVLYDTHIFQPLPAGTDLGSVTFTFGDGSSISLVGTADEIHNLPGLH
jgi:hypothetical protein